MALVAENPVSRSLQPKCDHRILRVITVPALDSAQVMEPAMVAVADNTISHRNETWCELFQQRLKGLPLLADGLQAIRLMEAGKADQVNGASYFFARFRDCRHRRSLSSQGASNAINGTGVGMDIIPPAWGFYCHL